MRNNFAHNGRLLRKDVFKTLENNSILLKAFDLGNEDTSSALTFLNSLPEEEILHVIQVTRKFGDTDSLFQSRILRPKVALFVGRNLEITSIKELFRSTSATGSQVIIISGQAGIGKSCQESCLRA